MLKILQVHLLLAFVANLKIDAIYALYPERFCDKNLAIRKVFAFCDSALLSFVSLVKFLTLYIYIFKDITPNPSQCQNFTGKSKNMNHPQSTQITAIKGG